MAVKTPSYWQEEEYQPLVEVETAYGNKVKIPQLCQRTWESYHRNQDSAKIAAAAFERDIAAGLYEDPHSHGQKIYMDMRKVFVEKYQE